MQNALGMTSDHVYRWRLLLEEYRPEIECNEGEDNTLIKSQSLQTYINLLMLVLLLYSNAI